MPSTVCLTFDFDALSVWLAYDEPTAAMLWRGENVAHCRDAGAQFERFVDVARRLPEPA